MPRRAAAVAALLVALSGRLPAQLPAELPEIDDPRLDGWHSETFGSEAESRLKEVLKLLQHREPLAAASLEPLVSPEFSGDPLRPPSLRTVFTDPSFEVLRGEGGESIRGVAGFLAALQELAAPVDRGPDLRFKVKTVGVTDVGERPSTRHLVSLIGTSGGAVVEQHAAWECVWDRRAGSLRLLSIAISDYEASRFRQPHLGATLFAEHTAAVLGGNRSFDEQLMRGRWQWMSYLEASFGTDVQGHSGLAIGDVNGDGLDDVYSCQVGGLPNLLFLQRPDGTVVDASAAAGVDWMDRSLATLLIDLDNDGDQDLAVSTVSALLVMENDGQGRFRLKASIRKARFAYSLAAADFDNDGDLDLYATRYSPQRKDPAYEAFVEVYNPLPYHDARNGAPNLLLENRGGFAFSDVTGRVGLDADNTRWSFAAAWEDFDNDGDQDLYVANDFGRNCLYENEGGSFANVAAELGVEDVASGMSVSWGDYDRDGWIDLYVGNMFSSAGNRVTFQSRFQPGFAPGTKRMVQRLARGNSLFRNRGGRFADVSVEAAVTMGRWSWGSLFADINNDGFEDLVVANGFLTGEDPHDL